MVDFYLSGAAAILALAYILANATHRTVTDTLRSGNMANGVVPSPSDGSLMLTITPLLATGLFVEIPIIRAACAVVLIVVWPHHVGNATRLLLDATSTMMTTHDHAFASSDIRQIRMLHTACVWLLSAAYAPIVISVCELIAHTVPS